MTSGIREGSAPEKLPDCACFSVTKWYMCPVPPLLNGLASGQEDIGLFSKFSYETFLGLTMLPSYSSNHTHTIVMLTSSFINLASSWALAI